MRESTKSALALLLQLVMIGYAFFAAVEAMNMITVPRPLTALDIFEAVALLGSGLFFAIINFIGVMAKRST